MTFALLKGNWRKLKYLEMYNPTLINYAIASACILHNFIKEEDDDGDYNFDDYIFDEIQNDIDEDGIDNDENVRWF